MLDHQRNVQLLWIPYVLLLLITSFTTGESLARTLVGTDIASRAICYLLSFIVLAILYSFGLREIKHVLKKGERGTAAFYIVFFTFLWIVVSVYTNTHSIYILLNKDEIRRNELGTIASHLESLRANTSVQLKNLEEEFVSEVDGLNNALSVQIQDPADPGLGEKAKAHIKDIETLLGTGSISLLKASSNEALAQKMVAQVNERLEQKMNGIRQPRSNVENLFRKDSLYQPLLEELQITINNYEKIPEPDIRNLLRRAYDKYHNYTEKIQPIFNTSFLEGNGQKELTALQEAIGVVPEQVESIELERIPNLLWYVKKHQPLSTFWWALALAIVIDAVSFWVYYAGILRAEDDGLPF